MVKIKCGGLNPSSKEWINIDKYKLKYTDIIVDLDKFPYPFKTRSIKEIRCHNVLEHLLYPLDVMMEFSRILKLKGKLSIIVPFYNYPRGSYSDITHLHYFNLDSIELLLNRFKINFKITKKKLHYSRYALIHWKVIAYLIPNYITYLEYELKRF